MSENSQSCEIPQSIAMSEFARKRHKAGGAYSYFNGDEAVLISLVKMHWFFRKPGVGRSDTTKVAVIKLPPENFVGTTIKLRGGMIFQAGIGQRQPDEDIFIRTAVIGEIKTPNELIEDGPAKGWMKEVTPDPVNFVSVVVYSKDALLENNGTRSSDADWEIVAITASEVEDEPMHPLAMARNFLEKTGGTFAPYDAKAFAESIYYWSQRTTVKK
jgi:hypothetical protein